MCKKKKKKKCKSHNELLIKPFRMSVIQNPETNKYWQGFGKRKYVYAPLLECTYIYAHTHLYIQPYKCSTISLLGILGIPKGCEHVVSKTYLHHHVYSSKFIVTEIWNQPRYPSAHEWVRKCDIFSQWNITIKANEILPFASKWMQKIFHASNRSFMLNQKSMGL